MKKKLTTATGNVTPTYPAPAPKPKRGRPKKEAPLTVYEASAGAISTSTTMRRNAASTIDRTDRFTNIDNGLTPYRHNSTIYGMNTSGMDVRDAVILCQKCYYNFALFRNIIDLMTEFSVSDIYYKGGSQQSQDLFRAIFSNMWALQDKFYREYYRSGNVFLYRFDTEIETDTIRQIITSLAAIDDGPQAKNPQLRRGPYPANPGEVQVFPNKIPARYLLLNPADIQMMSTLDFSYGLYFKILTDFEIARLRNPKTDEEVAVFKNLPPEVQEQIKQGSRTVAIPLDPNKVTMVFYKKQDYEPFAVPMGFPVLEDINAKYEMRKIDMAISRTMQQMVLLVTTGAKPEEGGVNQKNIDALKNIFANQSVGRTVIADYTTQVDFKTPQIAELLDPKKYVQIDQDINVGLNNVFAGSEKFANQAQKVELFIARLESGRKAFLNEFLIPEIKRIAKALNLKNYPTPYLDDVALKDNTNMAKLFARLIEIGVLTPEQGLEAIDSNRIPDFAEMEDAQKKYKDQRDDGLYAPLIGGPKDPNATGRPEGATAPQTTKTISPIGSKASTEEKYSALKIREHLSLSNIVESEVEKELKKLHKIKRLTKLQKEVVSEITTLVMANEEPAKWVESVPIYCAERQDRNHERVQKVIEIDARHGLNSTYLASVLLASKID